MPRLSHKLTRREFALFAGAATVSAGLGAFVRASKKPVPVTGLGDRRLAPFDRLMHSVILGARVPGATLAVARHGRLVYARGFGYADPRVRTPTQPDTLFRIAGVSKSLTAVAVLRLAQGGALSLDDPVLKYVHVPPFAGPDARLRAVTIRQCLHHTGGWDRDITPDPSSTPWVVAEALGIQPPLSIDNIVRYGLGRRLDFDPGSRHCYSNFGYLLLGRAIETASGMKYEKYVQQELLDPIDVEKMRLGRAMPENRFSGESIYHDSRNRFGRCLYPPRLGQPVPLPDGADNFEAFEAHGGWVGSAIDLVRFAIAFDNPEACPILSAQSVEEQFRRPEGVAGFESEGTPRDQYYACGWRVRPNGASGRPNSWVMGTIWGASAMLVRRGDGLCWAALFNTDSTPSGDMLPDVLDHRLHEAANAVTAWPNTNLFDLESKKS